MSIKTESTGKKRLRVLYLAGPGDVIGTYQHFIAGRDDPGQVCVTISGQFYQTCIDYDLEALVLSPNSRKDSIRSGRFEIHHRPAPFSNPSGVLFYLVQIWLAMRLIVSALRFRADIVIVTNWHCWFLLAILPTLGIRIVPALFCVMVPTHRKLSKVSRIIYRLDRILFKRRNWACISMSRAITRQMRACAGHDETKLIEFLPKYRESTFADTRSPPPLDGTFYVMFAGRIAKEKGVCDLLTIAQRFKSEGYNDIKIELCGHGPELDNIQSQIVAEGLQEYIRCAGYCNHEDMKKMYAKSHVVIVPTRTTFVEGFNMVVAEAVLSGRPVISSAVCPAVEYVPDAVVEVKPDDVKGYGDAILHIRKDDNYREKQAACAKYKGQFFNDEVSFGGALVKLLGPLLKTKRSPGADSH